MIGIDTNVLIRLVVSDDADQAAAARSLVARHAAESLWVDRVVLSEFVTVLERRYKMIRTDIADTVDDLLSADEFIVEDADCAEAALVAYRGGRDFADALIGAAGRKNGCRTTYTFDADATRLGTFTRLV
jgi:predicted nucleic-acid-binding protein